MIHFEEVIVLYPHDIDDRPAGPSTISRVVKWIVIGFSLLLAVIALTYVLIQSYLKNDLRLPIAERVQGEWVFSHSVSKTDCIVAETEWTNFEVRESTIHFSLFLPQMQYTLRGTGSVAEVDLTMKFNSPDDRGMTMRGLVRCGKNELALYFNNDSTQRPRLAMVGPGGADGAFFFSRKQNF